MVSESEEPQRKQGIVAAPVVDYRDLPDSAYAMWDRDELREWLGLAPGTRVEVFEGVTVVSPAALIVHNAILADINRGLVLAQATDPRFIWHGLQGTGMGIPDRASGFVPDLVVLDSEALDQALSGRIRMLTAEHVAMAVEVTSPSNADNDREPTLRSRFGSKWTGYARAGVPFHLLVDRDPRVARTTLYGDPEPENGRYTPIAAWTFGEPFKIPEPFDFTVDATRWTTWEG